MATGRNKICLLIDDDTDDQEVFVMALKQVDPGAECMIASNGVEAIERLKRNGLNAPEYIFLDINMPKMNGIDCLTEIRKMRHLNESKVIMYSTTSENKIMEKTRKLGANGFIVKPAEINALVQKISGVFKN